MQNGASGIPIVETVVKFGGKIFTHAALFSAAARAIDVGAVKRRLLVVPGGGRFVDTIRAVDRRLQLSDDAAHWLAVSAMDQTARLVAGRMLEGVVVTSFDEIVDVIDAGQIPVFAPLRCLLEADPLPHTWDVSSDSIAAWVAGSVGARHLILIKPPGVGHYSREELEMAGLDRWAGLSGGGSLVDAYFPQALPERVMVTIVPGDQVEELSRAMCEF